MLGLRTRCLLGVTFAIVMPEFRIPNIAHLPPYFYLSLQQTISRLLRSVHPEISRHAALIVANLAGARSRAPNLSRVKFLTHFPQMISANRISSVLTIRLWVVFVNF